MTPITEFPENIRFYDFDGSVNFRDIGGYQTEDGRVVRHDSLFRCGNMSYLSAKGMADLQALGIRAVCDFRSTDERDAHPNHWMADSDIHYAYRDDKDRIGDMADFYLGIQDAPEKAAEIMRAGYRTMPYNLAPSYRTLFEILLAAKVPMIFHCAGGKDRTGIAAGLILTALGVPQSTILLDYQATDRQVDTLYQLMMDQTKDIPGINPDRDLWSPLLASDPNNLLASFDEMTQRDGSVNAYLETHCGLDANAIQRLRELYTQ